MMVRLLRGKAFWLVSIPVIAVAIIYAPEYGGFWLGDDLPNLYTAHLLSHQGTLWSDRFRLFVEPVPSQGSFYRPLMMLSLAINYALAGTNYAGWYFVNFTVHLLNTLLVGLVVWRLARRCECDATIEAPLAAALFGLSPVIAEGVYWVAARADGWVTLLSLVGVYFWVGTATSVRSLMPFALPLLLIPALGFKESAAVLPLQMLALALAWHGPLSRSQRGAVFAAFILAACFLGWRAYLFGDAWQVYPHVNSENSALIGRLLGTLQSIGPWWTAVFAATPILSFLYFAFVAACIAILAFSAPTSTTRLSLGLACASAGLALATLLNLGAMSPSGEGGRLAYGPMAWLAITVGVAMAGTMVPPLGAYPRWVAAASAATMVAAIASGSAALWQTNLSVLDAQANMRAMTQSIPSWAESHPGMTMLFVPENNGAVVLSRNAQGSIALEPIQKQPYLHRVLPTLASEIQYRQAYFCGGMARRLEIFRQHLTRINRQDANLDPPDNIWPTHAACWSRSRAMIVSLPAPAMDVTCAAWIATLRSDIENCER